MDLKSYVDQVTQAENDVLGATRKIFAAISALDLVRLEQMLSHDYHYTSWHGEVLTKQQRLSSLRSLIGDQDAESFTLSELQVPLIHENVAVVVGRAHQSGRFRGERFDNDYRFTSVFRKERNEWIAAVHQVTRIELPPATAP